MRGLLLSYAFQWKKYEETKTVDEILRDKKK